MRYASRIPLPLLPLLAALALAGCSSAKWIRYGEGKPLEATALDGATVRSISFGILDGTRPVMLPSGDLIACQEVTPYEFRLERLTPSLARVWSTRLAVPDSRRTVGDLAWVLTADRGILLTRAGATVGLLCARRVGQDSLAISTRLFDTATGRVLRDTVVMRQHIDASIPEVARRISVARSPGGERIAVYARVRSYSLEATDLAIQILDPYLNPIETRKIRCRVADADQDGLVQVSDDGTILLLSKAGDREAELLRVPPKGGAPERRSILFPAAGDSLKLNHFVIALGGDGRLRIAATASQEKRFAGIASGQIDFAGSAPTLLTLAADLGTEALAAGVTDGGIRALMPLRTRDGLIDMVAVYALEISSRRGCLEGSALEIGVVGIDRRGQALWHDSFAGDPLDGHWRHDPIDATLDGGRLMITYPRNDSLIRQLCWVETGQSRSDDTRPLLRLGRTHDHADVMPGTIAWFKGAVLTFGVATQDREDIEHQDRKLVRLEIALAEDY